jgi:hypothetical protein
VSGGEAVRPGDECRAGEAVSSSLSLNCDGRLSLDSYYTLGQFIWGSGKPPFRTVYNRPLAETAGTWLGRYKYFL